MENTKPALKDDFDPEKFNLLPYIQEYIQDHAPDCPECNNLMMFICHHTPVYASLFKCVRCGMAIEVNWNEFDVTKLFSNHV